MICALTGIFTFAFSGSEVPLPWLFGILRAQETLNLCSIKHHLGIQGKAYFLPPSVTGEAKVMQFNPNSTYDGKHGSEKGSFREKGPAGLVISPSCDLLIQDLRKRNALVIPDNKEGITCLLRETIEDVFMFAQRVSVSWHGERVTITLHTYPAIDGCNIIMQKSAKCCTMNPCPVCSLCGTLIAEGINKIVAFEGCSVSSSSKDISAVFSILPSTDSNP